MQTDLARFLGPFIKDTLARPERFRWSLQGFGMLRAYISKELRLHVWDSRFQVPGVTMIHDHPWDFVSYVASGKITNWRYSVEPHDVRHDELWLKLPVMLKAQIVCGTGGGNDPATLRSRGEKVRLIQWVPDIHRSGDCYEQKAEVVHRTEYDDGTVTLVNRRFLPDTEHAHVFFPATEEWVSAEPRAATEHEVDIITKHALSRWRDL